MQIAQTREKLSVLNKPIASETEQCSVQCNTRGVIGRHLSLLGDFRKM